MRRTFAVMIACLSLVVVPTTVASAKATDPIAAAPAGLVAGPCANISLPKPADSLNIAGKTSAVMKLSVALKSCSTAGQSLHVTVVDSGYQNLGGADCSIAPFASGPFNLRSGETRTFSFQTPEPPAMICTHQFTETLLDDSGVVLGTAVQRFDTTSRI